MSDRYQQNLSVLKQLKNGKVSAEILRQYSGWGGLREAIYTPAVYQELKTLVGEAAIKSLKKTLRNAYYTPDTLVQFIFAALRQWGIQGGRVLEPAAGIGAFIEPLASLAPHEVVAIEIDQISCQLLQTLYPNLRVQQQGFETFQDGGFDLILGNPPYGSEVLVDPLHPDLNHLRIHHYFVAKAMRLLNPNGILAMVLPSYFLDNETQHAREIIAKEGGNLLAAYRLPDDLFADAKVMVDVIFLYKGETGEGWQKTQAITIDGQSKPINEYFLRHPANILGKLALAPMYHRQGLTCKSEGNLEKALLAQLTTLPALPQASRKTEANEGAALNILETAIAQTQASITTLQHKLSQMLATKDEIKRLQAQINQLVTTPA